MRLRSPRSNALRSVQTFDDKKRGTADAMAYAASVGLTTNVDMGAFLPPGLADIQDSFTFDGLATADPFRMYDAFQALHQQNKMTTRLRIFFLSMDTRPDVPMLKQRMQNIFPGLGDDMLKVSGIGEFAIAVAAVRTRHAARQLRNRAAVDRQARLGVPAAQSFAGRGPTHGRDV